MREDVTRGLPGDLAAVLRDQSVIVPQDAGVFELIANWASAPASTASAAAAVPMQPDMRLVQTLCQQSKAARSTTGVGC